MSYKQKMLSILLLLSAYINKIYSRNRSRAC